MDEILDRFARKRMLAWSLEGFKKNYARLYGAIIEIMHYVKRDEHERMMKFIEWYSGMDRDKIDNALERYKKEVENKKG